MYMMKTIQLISRALQFRTEKNEEKEDKTSIMDAREREIVV
jgi:hypothetical protein